MHHMPLKAAGLFTHGEWFAGQWPENRDEPIRGRYSPRHLAAGIQSAVRRVDRYINVVRI